MGTITENNKLIAEFMGDIESLNSKVSFSKNVTVENLKYNSDWNWLMEVVENIENLHHTNTAIIGRNTCFIKHYDKYKNESETIVSKSQFANVELTKIQAVYNACVAFIEWYNSAGNKIKP